MPRTAYVGPFASGAHAAAAAAATSAEAVDGSSSDICTSDLGGGDDATLEPHDENGGMDVDVVFKGLSTCLEADGDHRKGPGGYSLSSLCDAASRMRCARAMTTRPTCATM